MKNRFIPFIVFAIIILTTTGFSEEREIFPPNEEKWVEKTLKDMNLKEKIGQLFMIAAYSNQGEDHEKQIENIVRKHHVGGVIFFQGDPVRQVNFTNKLQKVSKYPLMIGLDAEHGAGWRLKEAMTFPQMLTNGAVQNDSLIYRLGAAIARHCKELGVHVNFAPSADINNNPLNPVIGMRSFGEDRENVFRKAYMYIQGSLSENILAVAKHFPGHGDTDTDSHHALPLINHSFSHIDSLELYPFKKLIKAGIPSIMVAHLQVSALDSNQIPASLSPDVINGFLRNKLHFDGLCFTDAMNMKGVTKIAAPGEAELKAFEAGNDILLFPENIEAAIKTFQKAISDKRITEAQLDEKCRKILKAKYKYVLPNQGALSTDRLWSRLNPPTDQALKQELYKEAITLLDNKNNLLPLKSLDTLRIASINFGSGKINHFQTMLSNYAPVSHFSIPDTLTAKGIETWINKLSGFNCIIIYNAHASNRVSRNFGFSGKLASLMEKLSEKNLIYCHPAIPYGISGYIDIPVDAVLVSYEDNLSAAQYAAQAIFGGIPVSGKLSVSIDDRYPVSHGLYLPKTRLGYLLPEQAGIDSRKLTIIDSICKAAVALQATPGCQVLIAKNDYVIYNKVWGNHRYKENIPNHTSDIYDIASVTKIAATMPSVMRLYEEKKLDLDKPLSEYYPPLKNTNKADITLRELLAHHAGFKKSISFFHEFIDPKSIPGYIFSVKPTKTHTKKLYDRLYVNPNFRYRANTIALKRTEGLVPVAAGVYANQHIRDSILQKILDSEVSNKKDYNYSDLGFILLKEVVEEITGEPFADYCNENFYNKLGMYNTRFLAAENLKNRRVVPSSVDNLFRNTEIKGYPHDPTAFLLGGVAGHAGLFSSANDLAILMSMYLHEGRYGGEKYFSPATIIQFAYTQNDYMDNRRGLGFDKPESDTTKVSPAGRLASPLSFGHLGFTGIMAWADPENDLVYIFLSNRTHPNEFNTKLMDENIRTTIHDVIYGAEGNEK